MRGEILHSARNPPLFNLTLLYLLEAVGLIASIPICADLWFWRVVKSGISDFRRPA